MARSAEHALEFLQPSWVEIEYIFPINCAVDGIRVMQIILIHFNRILSRASSQLAVCFKQQIHLSFLKKKKEMKTIQSKYAAGLNTLLLRSFL